MSVGGGNATKAAAVARLSFNYSCWRYETAVALVPVILAALAAITALAVATGKAATAMEAAVRNGERLWTVLTSIPEQEAARLNLAQRQRALRAEMGIRRGVVAGAAAAQQANAAFVNSMKLYLVTRDTNAWDSVVPSMVHAASPLESMAAVFREKAVWFPAAAQESLAQLPNLYEARVSIIQQLSKEPPPRTDKELRAWRRLVDGYDQLRVQSLKLVRALDDYTTG